MPKINKVLNDATEILTKGDCEIVEIIKRPEEQSLIILPEITKTSTEEDFETVRVHSLEIMDEGRDALAKLFLISTESEHPRAFEVAANLMRAISEVGRDLIIMHEKMADMKNKKDKIVNQTTINTGDTNILSINPTKLLEEIIQKTKER